MKNYDKGLDHAIADDTSGYFKKGLMDLLKVSALCCRDHSLG